MRGMKVLAAVLVATWVAAVSASGPVGLYGIVEKVVFEPNEQAPERLQLWGAFAYADQTGSGAVSAIRRGYMYFRLPDARDGLANSATVDTIRKEWADFKALAGTGQAVGFGRWGYIAGFASLDPQQRPVAPSFVYHNVPSGGAASDLRVRPASEPPANPAIYQTNAGIVKIADTGNHAALVKQLRDALK